MNSTALFEGVRIFRASAKRRVKGPHKFHGSAIEIAQKCVDACWNGAYFQVSTGNFHQFYVRDFGWCVDALCKLGYRKHCKQSLRYALDHFVLYGKTTNAITPKGVPFDFPTYSIDTVPFLMRSLRVAGMKAYVKEHRDFLEQELEKLAGFMENGLVTKNKHFSSMKDLALRESSCYDNIMIAMLKNELKSLGISNPFKENYKKIIKDNFWNGEYFLDDLSGKEYVAGDANLFPFWTKVFTEKEMMKKAFQSIMDAGLDKPFPLRYTNENAPVKFVRSELFSKNYERDVIWTHMGPLYMRLLKSVNKERYLEHNAAYTRILEHYGNYLEVFFPSGKPYHSPFYYSDETMLWAANVLA